MYQGSASLCSKWEVGECVKTIYISLLFINTRIKTNILLIVFLGLIANLALVSGNCNLGTPTLHDFDYSRVLDLGTGSFTPPAFWRTTLTASHPDMNILREIGAYPPSTHMLSGTWSGVFRVEAIHYDRYVIGFHCSEQTGERNVYVVYRSHRPDQETLNEVHREMQDKNIDVSQLVDWPAHHCQQAESSAASLSSA